MASNENPENVDDENPSGFEDAVEQQPDLDEENRRRFPQIPALAFHPWEGIEQEQIDDEDQDQDEQMNLEEDQLDRLQEQIRHIQRHLLLDLNHRRDDDEDNEDEEWEDEEISSGEENIDGGATVTYDRSLPTSHSYLNVENFQEFSGVCLLTNDRRFLLHIVELANMILIPNQIVPWQIFNSRMIRMIKEAKQEQRLFGVIDACSSLLNNEPKFGTTAEIVSFHEEPIDNSLQLKIIGRQRFIIDDPSTMKRDLNGILRANVRILPEIILRRPPLPMLSQKSILTINFLLQTQLRSQREKFFNKKSFNENDDDESTNGVAACGQAFVNFIKRQRTTSSTSQKIKTFVDPKQILLHRRCRTNSWALSPYPYWIIRQYDEIYVMSLIKFELSNTMLATDDGSLPITADRFADWLLINIPFEIQTVQKILSFPTIIQRLRFVLSWLRRYKKFACRHCAADICEDRDIFSMSASGLMAAYVNPHGQIHETLTVLRVKNIQLLGHEVAEHSWFPGYKWTIVQCCLCGNHLGWRFRNPTLKPPKFYGLTRNGLIFARDSTDDDRDEDQDDSDERQRRSRMRQFSTDDDE